jgi:hypothetical protein
MGYTVFFFIYLGFLALLPRFSRGRMPIFFKFNSLDFLKLKNTSLYLLIFLLLTQIFPFVSYLKSKDHQLIFGGQENLFITAAEWANENIPEEAIGGAWAAGQLGYHLKQRTIQLEGLVNDYDYISILKRENFAEYVCKESIDYIFLNFDGYILEKNFRPSDLYHPSSPFREYRARFLNAIWPSLTEVWSRPGSNFNSDTDRKIYFYIWKVDRAIICGKS